MMKPILSLNGTGMTESTLRARHYQDEGTTWLRIHNEENGEIWEEPIHGWELVHCIMALNVSDIGTFYRHRDGRKAIADQNLD